MNLEENTVAMVVDWTRLPEDIVIQFFRYLNNRDRASLSSTCRAWRALGSSSCLWNSLDLSNHKFDDNTAASLASRCGSLQKLRFWVAESIDAIVNLRAENLCEISGSYCERITDESLVILVARHQKLESLELGPDCGKRLSSDPIKAISCFCPKLKKLHISRIRHVRGDAINALARNCPNLIDLAFINCLKVEEAALGTITSVCFLSIAGTSNIKWDVVSQLWDKLPNLIGLDVSRTNVSSSIVSSLMSTSKSLKVLCALNCPKLEEDVSYVQCKSESKALLALFTDILVEIACQFAKTIEMRRNVFLGWQKLNTRDKNLDEVMTWLEWILCHTLSCIVQRYPQNLHDFWHHQGAVLLLTLMQSTQEDIQERAATCLKNFMVLNYENESIVGIIETVSRHGGVRILLDLAKSWRDGLQSYVTTAIGVLCVNPSVAKTVVEQGGINILVRLAKSPNRLVVKEAAAGLCNLSCGEEHKGAIVEAGGAETLVRILFNWFLNGDGILQPIAAALANLASDRKCSMEIAKAYGVHALVMLARCWSFDGVQELTARALANLASHGGALEGHGQSTPSPHEGVSIAIGKQGGVNSSSNVPVPFVSKDVHETIADARRNPLLCIMKEGGVLALANICDSSPSVMARFMAVWALACIYDTRMEEYAQMETSSEGSSISMSIHEDRKTAREHIETFIHSFTDPKAFRNAIASSAPPDALTQIAERVRIREAGYLICSGAMIRRFIAMMRNPSSVLKAFAAFSLVQLTMPGDLHAAHHASLIHNAQGTQVLNATARAAISKLEAKIFATIVLRNLEQHHLES